MEIYSTKNLVSLLFDLKKREAIVIIMQIETIVADEKSKHKKKTSSKDQKHLSEGFMFLINI